MAVQTTQEQYDVNVDLSCESKASFLIPSSEDRAIVMGKINLEDSVNSPPCDCTSCGSCRCTPCK